MQIDHNPNERRPPKWFWWAIFAVIAGLWLLQARHGFEWDQVMLGLGTGALLVGWVAETYGLDTPESWRRKPPRQR